nr:hypothetical protein Hi04_10k_c3807_00002 [uncultured bacterium]
MKSTEIFIMDGMHHEKLKKIIYRADGSTVRIDSTGSGESIRFPLAVDDRGEEYRWLPQLIYKAARLFDGEQVIDLMKLSATPEKATRPARTLHRVFKPDGKMLEDVAGLDRVGDGSGLPPAPAGGTVIDRLQLLAENGNIAREFSLDDQAYWAHTRQRFAGEAATLPNTWQERDALRAQGKAASVPFRESQELSAAVEQAFVAAGRGDELNR